jgi:peptidoglycan hydrolase-like protein with peptidoglycan-binding domain
MTATVTQPTAPSRFFQPGAPNSDLETFCNMWRNNHPLDDLFPDNPFLLDNSVGPLAKNQDSDVAKVQSLLHDAGYLDANQSDGPTGIYSRVLMDTPIKAFQSDHGLEPDGVLNPAGPTITRLEEKLRPALNGANGRDLPFVLNPADATALAPDTANKVESATPLPNVDPSRPLMATLLSVAQAAQGAGTGAATPLPASPAPTHVAAASGTPASQGLTTGHPPNPSATGGAPGRLPATVPDPWPQSPLTHNYRKELADRESQGHGGYRAENPGKAWGRYQLTRPGLQDIGMMDKNGMWTGKYGIHSADEFKNDREAQERALAEYTAHNSQYLKANGSIKRVGRQIDGIRAKFTVTETGLLAAAHRYGHGTVKSYLDFEERHGWKSGFGNLSHEQRAAFQAVESRLREFQNVRNRK